MKFGRDLLRLIGWSTSSTSSSIIKVDGLVNMEPNFLKPVWRNNKYGQDGISKNLDNFLFQIHFLLFNFIYTSNGIT
jgi:hypothetical protein